MQNIRLKDICRNIGRSDSAHTNYFNLYLKPLEFNEEPLITVCPSKFKNDFQSLQCAGIEEIANLPTGLYRPTEEYNLTADIIGIFDVLQSRSKQPQPKRLIVFIQVKDWFKSTVEDRNLSLKKHMLAELRWGKQFVLNKTVPTSRVSQNSKSLPNPFAHYWEQNSDHKAVFILFSANPITSTEFGEVKHYETCPDRINKTLCDNEATTDLDHAKLWFPTFGYNLLAGHKMQELWSDMPESPCLKE